MPKAAALPGRSCLKAALSFGLRAEELPLVKQYMINAVEEDRPVVCAMAPGDFTTTGHSFILTGYDENGFTVNDPNSPMRSSQHWTYETLEGQISNLWAFGQSIVRTPGKAGGLSKP